MVFYLLLGMLMGVHGCILQRRPGDTHERNGVPLGVSLRHKEEWAAEFARVAEAGEACTGIYLFLQCSMLLMLAVCGKEPVLPEPCLQLSWTGAGAQPRLPASHLVLLQGTLLLHVRTVFPSDDGLNVCNRN